MKQSTFGTGQGLPHSLNIYNTGPISPAPKCTGGETVKHSTPPIAKGKGVFVGNIVVHIQTKYRKDWMKTEAYGQKN